jgi:hypothetical protein
MTTPTEDDFDDQDSFSEDLPFPDSDKDSGGVDLLESLLQESLSTIKDRAFVKEGRKKLAQGKYNTAEKAEIDAKIKEWELAREWKPAANVAMFNTQSCRCGSRHAIFSGWFQRQHHRKSNIDRWVRPEADPIPSLPNERQDLELSPTTICASCAPAQGFYLPTEGQVCPPQKSGLLTLKSASTESTSSQEVHLSTSLPPTSSDTQQSDTTTLIAQTEATSSSEWPPKPEEQKTPFAPVQSPKPNSPAIWTAISPASLIPKPQQISPDALLQTPKT